MRIVLDTSVLVAAIRSSAGASSALLEEVFQGSVKILISNALVLEYEAVLTRPVHLLASGLTAGKIDELLNAVCRIAVLVPIHQQ